MLIRLLRTGKRLLQVLAGREISVRLEVTTATEFHGTVYGGWAILKGSLDADSIIYSFGVGEDASFDLSLIGKYGCRVHAFDPTPKSADWVAENIQDGRFVFEKSALADHDGTIRLYLPRDPRHVSASLVAGSRTAAENHFAAPCYRLESILNRLGHSRLDVLKMDIEGAEYSVLQNILASHSLAKPRQLLVEFHHWMHPFSVADTRKTLAELNHADYRVAWISGSGHEVLFIQK
jgi:FkbM family methyltransferase